MPSWKDSHPFRWGNATCLLSQQHEPWLSKDTDWNHSTRCSNQLLLYYKTWHTIIQESRRSARYNRIGCSDPELSNSSIYNWKGVELP
jgi:hypothetical protein